jgi:two-component system cell cycle sensor histidine kinase/response regulator CckA
MADLNQLEQVIVNLTLNAGDAMPEGGEMTIHTRNVSETDCDHLVYTHGMPAGEYVLMEVKDTGNGMSPEIMDKMFDPFFTTKAIGEGTGLGLSTVYGIIKQTGGFIFCTSEIDIGTTFHLFLPRHTPQETNPNVPDGKRIDPEQVIETTGSMSILLVDDEGAVRTFGARALASRGYKVYQAGSAIEALEVMKQTEDKIDLVVSDVVLPKMDGPSLLVELRKIRPDLKIIFVSGYAEDSFEERLPPGEKFYFLPKPFSLKQLATTVTEVLSD